MEKIDHEIDRLKKAGTPFVIATVVKVTGSAPRHIGSKMIVTADGLNAGTIGGGNIEYRAIDDAKKVLSRCSAECISYDLTEKAGQVCGGLVEIFFESIVPPKKLILFGAGHVAEKLAPILNEIGYDITLVDERSDRLEIAAFQCCSERINKLPVNFFPSMKFYDELHIISMTHDHKHDREIVEFSLGKNYKYLGLISSRKKWKTFSKAFLAKGFSEKDISRVDAPLGLDIGAETPLEIAVAVAGKLIDLYRRK